MSEAAAHKAHAFWADSLSLLQPKVVDWLRVLGHRQVTDNYLLALAVRNGGRPVTFDARLDLSAAHGASA